MLIILSQVPGFDSRTEHSFAQLEKITSHAKIIMCISVSNVYWNSFICGLFFCTVSDNRQCVIAIKRKVDGVKCVHRIFPEKLSEERVGSLNPGPGFEFRIGHIFTMLGNLQLSSLLCQSV